MTPTLDAAQSDSPVVEGALRGGRRVFQRYVLRRLVGRGGMGVVWLAHDDKLDRSVALKFLPEILFSDAAARDDLKRETRRSLDLTHPHIVRIHDFVEDDEMAAIAMEYVDGPTLSELRVQQASRYFEPEALSVWTAGLCAALEYAHEAGRCVHRDLKPGNLMVSGRGVLKVADFGISCSLHNTAARVSAWASTGGTLGYMSPQQLLGELAAPADDIYSVGATLYELLTGKPPFHSGDLAVQIREVVPESIAERRRRLGLPGGPIPAAWEETIAACLAKKPGQRPTSAGEIARRLGLTCHPLAEAAPALGEVLAPTICSAPTDLVRRPRRSWPLTIEDARRLAAPLMRYRWPIMTSFAAAAAIVPWLGGSHSTREAVVAPAPTVALVAPVAEPAPPARPSVPPAPVEVDATPAAPRPAEPNGDAQALLAPIPAPTTVALEAAPSSAPAPAESGPQVQIETTPPGIPFQVLASAYESPMAEVLRTGETPATLRDLAPGAYRVVFNPAGFAARSASVRMPAEGVAVFRQDLPHGVVHLRSQPDGADVVCDGRDLGQTPLDVAVLPGRHEFFARWNGRDSRPRVAQVADAAEQTVAFDFREGGGVARSSRSRTPKKVENESMFTKVGRTLTTVFGGGTSGNTKARR